jgi:hypothetical protein
MSATPRLSTAIRGFIVVVVIGKRVQCTEPDVRLAVSVPA